MVTRYRYLGGGGNVTVTRYHYLGEKKCNGRYRYLGGKCNGRYRYSARVTNRPTVLIFFAQFPEKILK